MDVSATLNSHATGASYAVQTAGADLQGETAASRRTGCQLSHPPL